jgi:Protein of unknown function (DUF2442)
MRISFERPCMNTLAIDVAIPTSESVIVTNDMLTAELSDGRSLSVPLAWFLQLVHATATERRAWRFIGRGRGIHWDKLDEDISIDGLLAGKPSGESQDWLISRQGARSRRTKSAPVLAGASGSQSRRRTPIHLLLCLSSSVGVPG